MITILDISNWQHRVDFERVRFHGVQAVMLKAAEGLTFNDKTYHERHKQALAAGLFVGAYFFAQPHASEPELQADHFARVVGDVDWDHERALRPWLDYEVALANGHDEAWIRRWNHRTLTLTGVGPSFYSYPALIAQLKLERPVGWGLVLSAFDRNDGVEHPYTPPAPWRRTIAHQFSSRCHVGGCYDEHGGLALVDLSHARSLVPLVADPERWAGVG